MGERREEVWIQQVEEIAIGENWGASGHGLVRDRPSYAIIEVRFADESLSNG